MARLTDSSIIEFNDLRRVRKFVRKSIDIAEAISDSNDRANAAKGLIVSIADNYYALYKESFISAQTELIPRVTEKQWGKIVEAFENGSKDGIPGFDRKIAEEYSTQGKLTYRIDSYKSYASYEIYLDNRKPEYVVKDFLISTFEKYNYIGTLKHKIVAILEATSPNYMQYLGIDCGLWTI